MEDLRGFAVETGRNIHGHPYFKWKVGDQLMGYRLSLDEVKKKEETQEKGEPYLEVKQGWPFQIDLLNPNSTIKERINDISIKNIIKVANDIGLPFNSEELSLIKSENTRRFTGLMLAEKMLEKGMRVDYYN